MVSRTVLFLLGVIVMVAAVLYPWLHPKYPSPTNGSIVITGCSSGGLGFQLAKTVIRTQPRTVKVICTVRKDADRIELLKDELLGNKDNQERFSTVLVDVKDLERVKALRNDLKNENVIALVNNAGTLKYEPIEDMDYRDMMHVNLFGLLDMTQSLLPLLKLSAPGSRVVNIGSMAGMLSRPGSLGYSTSKRAVEGATDAMRVELLRYGISVSVIEPGFFSSRMCEDQKHCVGGIEEVVDVILHALFSTRPNTRYPVGTLGLTPAWMGARLATFVPDRILDTMLVLFDPWKTETDAHYKKQEEEIERLKKQRGEL